MNRFHEASWFAKSFGYIVALAYSFSCLGFSGPILSDNALAERIFSVDPNFADPRFWLISILIELPQFTLFVLGSTYLVHVLANGLRRTPRVSLSTILCVTCAFAVCAAILTAELEIFHLRANSKLYGYVDYASPVWLIEGPFLTNYVLIAGLFGSAFGVVHASWGTLKRTAERNLNSAT